MATFTAKDTPAHIVKVFPKASELFKEERIDFCCNGNRQLEDVFTEDNLDGRTILDVLNEDYNKWQKEDHDITDWDSLPLSELVDHIVHEHHAYLKEELGPLSEFVLKIFRVHGAHHPHLKELNRIFNEFKLEMEEHMLTEENEVFPLIKEYEKNPSEKLKEHIIEANGGLEDEHETAGNLLKRMREITNGFQTPPDGCTSYNITYSRLAEVETDTFQHVHLENNVLFKRL